MKYYMKKHVNCPYYNKGKDECCREGCLFKTPCELVNESRNRTFIRIKKRG